MKLCLISPAPPPNGGIANWTNIMRKEMSKQTWGIEFSFINIAPSVSYTDRKGIVSHIIVSGRELLRQRRELIEQIKKNKPDIVHLTTSGHLSLIRDFVLLHTMNKYNIPCAYHLHFGRLKQIVETRGNEFRLLEKNIKKSAITITIDNYSYSALKKSFEYLPIKNIPNPVDLECFPAKGIVNKKEILFVGWIIKQKGMEELIKAWNSIKHRYLEYSLHCIGPSSHEYKEYLIKSYDMERIVFEGELSHRETLERINECEIFILPSYTEGFPNVILEAMGLEKTIIATKVGAIPEMLEGKSGVLIEPKSETEIQRALCKLLDNSWIRRELSRNAYQKVVKKYVIEKIFKEYVDVWRAL